MWHPGGDMHFKTGETHKLYWNYGRLMFVWVWMEMRSPNLICSRGELLVIAQLQTQWRTSSECPQKCCPYSLSHGRLVTNSCQYLVQLTCFINLRLHCSHQKPNMNQWKNKSVRNNKYSSAKSRYSTLWALNLLRHNHNQNDSEY